jgi:hypothetical protein
MIKYLTCISAFILANLSLNAQLLNKSDSILIKNYWNKINIKSIDSNNNFLYSGIDNNLNIIFPNEELSHNRVILKTNNGKIFKNDGGWLTIPGHSGRSFISIYLITLNSDSLIIGKKEFIVKQVPVPVLKLHENIIKDSAILNHKIFYTADSLKLYFTDDLSASNNWFQIKNFTIGYSFGGKYVSVDNEGAVFSTKSLELISKMEINQQLVINITSITPTGILKYLPLIRFRVY